MGIYSRGRKLWARFKDSTGAWVSKSTPYEVGQEAEAQRYFARRVANASTTRTSQAGVIRPGVPVQLRTYAEKWLKERRDLGIHSIADDDSRMKRHILPRSVIST